MDTTDEPERVVVSPRYVEGDRCELSEFDPESKHRAWSSWERDKRRYDPEFYRFYRGSSEYGYPILPRELVDRYNAAQAAFDALNDEVYAAIAAAPRKTLDAFAEELGWTPDDYTV